MLSAVVAGITFPFRLDPARMSARARVFDLCPLFLLAMLIPLTLAELDAARLGVKTPLEVIPLHRLPIDAAVFAIPFAWAARPTSLREVWSVLAASLILPLSNSVMPYALGMTAWLYPHICDPQVVVLDATLGMQPSLLLGEAFNRIPMLAWLAGAIYGAIIFPVAMVAVIEAQGGRRMGLGALPTFLALAAIGYAFYALTPVIGPAAYFGHGFPFLPGRAHPPLPRNGMPSLHTAWVLMAFLATRGMSWPIRWTAGIWLIGTVIATLGSGEHYLTDLVIAVPLVVLLRALCAIDVPWSVIERRASLWTSLLLYLVWVLAIRGTIHLSAVPGLASGFMVVTVVASLWWERKLARFAGLLTNIVKPAGSVWHSCAPRRFVDFASDRSILKLKDASSLRTAKPT